MSKTAPGATIRPLKKQFADVAGVVKAMTLSRCIQADRKEQRFYIAKAFAEMFKEQFPRFDIRTFMDMCESKDDLA